MSTQYPSMDQALDLINRYGVDSAHTESGWLVLHLSNGDEMMVSTEFSAYSLEFALYPGRVA